MKLSQLLKPSAYKARAVRFFMEVDGKPSYRADGLVTYDKTISFLSDPKFMSAYRRGMNSGHHIGRAKGSDTDIHIEYRTYIECWAASQCALLPGDFVCCGVNTGTIPLAICEYVDIDKTDKKFWLFDTYEGIPEAQMSPTEHTARMAENAMIYSDCYDLAVNNFAPFKNARLVRGMVPDTLTTVDIERVSYLSIDMNITYPERKAIEFFWPRMSSGALVILDDYAFAGYPEQKVSMDDFAASVGVSVLTLPTGQGMMKKP